MKNQWKIIVILVLFALASFKGMVSFYKGKLSSVNLQLRKEIIKGDSLTMVKDGLYTKLIADTLKRRHLRKQVDSLELEIKDPKIVTVIKYVPKIIEKEVDGIVIKDSILTVSDNYPSKDSAFVSYNADINLITSKGIGKFTFEPIEFAIGIGQNKDGTYSLNTKVPDFFKVTDVKVNALPLEIPETAKKDNFGIIVGVGIGTNFDKKLTDFYSKETGFKNNETFFKLSTDLRFNKVYLGVEAATNKTVSGGIKFEF